jgi:hypothetical protein
MQIEIINTSNLKEFSFFNESKFPLFFSQANHGFENLNGFETGMIKSSDHIFIPFRIYKKYFFRFLQFMYTPCREGERVSAAEEKFFLDATVAHLKERKFCQRIIMPFVYDVFASYPDGSTHCHFGQIYLDIEHKNIDDLFTKFDAKYRTQIRQVLSNAERIESRTGIQELENVYKIYKGVHEAQGLYHDSLQHFLNMHQTHQEKNMLVLNVYCDGSHEGGTIVTFNQNEAYYLNSGVARKTIIRGSNRYLQYEALKFLIEKGVKRYVFGGCRLSDTQGTKLDEIQEFKLRFGSTIKRGYIWKMDIDSFYCKMFDSLIAIQCKLRGAKIPIDTIDYEKDRPLVR